MSVEKLRNSSDEQAAITVALQELCKGKKIEKLENEADWFFRIGENDCVEFQYEKQGFIKGISVMGLIAYQVTIEISQGYKSVLIFASNTFIDVVNRIKVIPND